MFYPWVRNLISRKAKNISWEGLLTKTSVPVRVKQQDTEQIS